MGEATQLPKPGHTNTIHLCQKHSFSGQYWFQVTVFLCGLSETQGTFPSHSDALTSQNQTSAREVQQVLLFLSFGLTSCIPLGPGLFGSLFSANQRIITSNQYYCLQEDPHHILHIFVTILVKILAKRGTWKIGVHLCLRT